MYCKQLSKRSRFSKGKKVDSRMVFILSAYDASLGGAKNGKLSKRDKNFLVNFCKVEGQKIIPCSMSWEVLAE